MSYPVTRPDTYPRYSIGTLQVVSLTTVTSVPSQYVVSKYSPYEFRILILYSSIVAKCDGGAIQFMTTFFPTRLTSAMFG